MRRKKIKLQNLDAEIRSSSNDKPQIFRGVVAFVNGYTQPSLNDLHRLIVGHGGGFLQYLDGKTFVTHVIASNLTPKKKVELQRYRVIKPAWVVDSVNAGYLLPWDNYRIVDEGVGQKILGFENGRMVSQTNTQQTGYREQTDISWYTSQIGENTTSSSTANRDIESSFLGLPPTSGADKPPSPAAPSQRDVDDGKISTGNETSLDDQLPDLEERNKSAPWQSHLLPTQEPEDLFDVEAGEARTQDQGDSYIPIHTSPISYRQDGKELVQRGAETVRQSKSPPNVSQLPETVKLTAEEHNAILLSDPRMRKSSTVNPDFLKQYYQESRLHHLSTWKAELKAKLQALTQEKASNQTLPKRKPGARRYVMHVDFDSFFAAVSLRKKPQLAEKPVVIAHGSGSGSEIASCNYPARKYGIKNGMWMKTAQQLCSELQILPYDFTAYEEASRHFYDAILETNGIVQSVSIDEALVDVSAQCLSAGGTDGKGVHEGSNYREQAEADRIGKTIRDLVHEKTGCAVSVGIGGNILLAKIACRKAKPAGQCQVKPEQALDILGDLTVQELPGVAYSIGGKLEEIGVKYVKDIRNVTKERLVSTLGPKTGEKIWDYSRGIDKVEVGEQVIRKSVSAEVNWGIRFVTQAQADEFVHSLCEELHRRLVETNVKGKQITMKIMRRAADAPLDPPKHLGHGKCDTFNKSVVLGVATNAPEVLSREALSILKGFGFSPGELRGLGVQMTKLEPVKHFSTKILDSSQKRLQFKQPSVTPKEETNMEDPIVDDNSPGKQNQTKELQDRVEGAVSKDFFDDKPLNLLGTQFVIPSQIDPEVLAELPLDIRSKLEPRQKPIGDSLPRVDSTGTGKSRSHSPFASFDLPNQSQLDPGILSELPEDVQNEVRDYYSKPLGRQQAQQLLPQSPRKSTVLPKKKLNLTPTKKNPSLFSRGKPTRTSKSNSTLTQSNFVSAVKASSNAPANINTSGPDPEISPDFLAALPPDIRRELLDQRKRDRLKTKSGLNLNPSIARKRPPAAIADTLTTGQRKLKLQPRPEKPTFTSRKLSTIEELRQALSTWIEEFLEEGPFVEDVEALGAYLGRVVVEEKDLEKAVQLVGWTTWTVTEKTSDMVEGRESWESACEQLRKHVREAARQRGMMEVVFS